MIHSDHSIVRVCKSLLEIGISPMADDIALKVLSLKITEAEDTILDLDNVTITEHTQDLDLALVGKFLSVWSFNFEAQKRTLNQIWAIFKGALFRPIENGHFVVQFASKRDKTTKVLAGRPWTFDQHLVMLQEIEDDVQLSALNLCPFWIRLTYGEAI